MSRRSPWPFVGLLFLLALSFPSSCRSNTLSRGDQSPAVASGDAGAVGAGRIVYRTTYFRNPAYDRASDPRKHSYSEGLRLAITRHNVPERREIWFDGRRSRSETVDFGYGVRSRSVLLRRGVSPEERTETYCKELRHLRFCVEYDPGIPIREDVPPRLVELDREEQILGLVCRSVGVEDDTGSFVFSYVAGMRIEDATGATLQHAAVDGFVLRREETPEAKRGAFLSRTTMVEFERVPPPEGTFDIPEGFERFPSVDAARTENRRRLDAWAEAQRRSSSASPDWATMYLGAWLLDNGEDRILVEIEAADADPGGRGALRSTTTILSPFAPASARPVAEDAVLAGPLLLVEEPPNFRLYEISSDRGQLTWIDHPAFGFRRIPLERARSLGPAP